MAQKSCKWLLDSAFRKRILCIYMYSQNPLDKLGLDVDEI